MEKENDSGDVRYTILYVDDEEANLRIFKHAFSREYNILLAETGEKALEILGQSTPVDLIVTDQIMPKMTGVQLLKEVRKDHPDIIRMILTGFSDIAVIIEAVNEIGIHRYIKKPWDRNDLNTTFRQALESRKVPVSSKNDGGTAPGESGPAKPDAQHKKDGSFPERLSPEVNRLPFTSISLENAVRLFFKDQFQDLSTRKFEFFKLAFLMRGDATYQAQNPAYTIASYVLKSKKGLVLVCGDEDAGIAFLDLDLKDFRQLVKRADRLVHSRSRKGFNKLQEINDRLKLEVGYSYNGLDIGDNSEDNEPDQITFWIDDRFTIEMDVVQWSYLQDRIKSFF